MMQMVTAMGNWWLAASSRQCTCSCITSHAVFWQNIKPPRWLSPPTAQIWCPVTLAFPTIKITFEREEISELQWDSGNTVRQLMAVLTKDFAEWKRCPENCVRSQGACFEEDWGVIVLSTMFLVSCIFFNECVCFSQYMVGYLLDRTLYMCTHTDCLTSPLGAVLAY